MRRQLLTFAIVLAALLGAGLISSPLKPLAHAQVLEECMGPEIPDFCEKTIDSRGNAINVLGRSKQTKANNEFTEALTKGGDYSETNTFNKIHQTLMTISTMITSDGLPTSTTADASHSKSFVTEMTGLIGTMYSTPPSTTQSYVAYVIQSTHLIEPAQAQGLGFSALSPVLGAWTTFRNLAYLLFVILFLAIGFMIMFRQKIGGQTVVTAQQALPKIIMSLIFVTFSYAIAGLLIDAMYLIMFLLVTLFGYKSDLIGLNFLDVGWVLLTQSGSIGQVYNVAGEFISQSLGGVAGQFDLVDAIGIAGGAVTSFVFAIAILIGVFQLFFELLKTYATIIISIVISPITLMMGAIPGKNAFGPWLRGLIGNLAAFPTVLIILIIYDQITLGIGSNWRASSLLNPQNDTVYAQLGPGATDAPTGGFIPPYLIGSAQGNTFGFLFGLALLLAMTEIVKQVKKGIGGNDQFGWFTSAVAQSLKSGYKGDVPLIPGMKWTAPANMPGLNKLGGLSGENLGRKAGITAAGLGTGLLGAAAPGLMHNEPGNRRWGFGRSFDKTVGYLGRQFNDPNYKEVNKPPETKK